MTTAVIKKCAVAGCRATFGSGAMCTVHQACIPKKTSKELMRRAVLQVLNGRPGESVSVEELDREVPVPFLYLSVLEAGAISAKAALN